MWRRWASEKWSGPRVCVRVCVCVRVRVAGRDEWKGVPGGGSACLVWSLEREDEEERMRMRMNMNERERGRVRVLETLGGGGNRGDPGAALSLGAVLGVGKVVEAGAKEGTGFG